MADHRASGRRRAGLALALAGLVGIPLLGLAPAQAVPSTVPPVLQRTPAVTTADALPTVQVNGVVWTQAMIGNTVYAAGSFSTARPAGAAPGESTTRRKNVLAYRITTGKLVTTFKPAALDGQVKALAVSADQKTVFLGGDFTKVGKAKRLHFAALDARTGALRKPAPAFNSRVNAISVVGNKVFVGDWFSRVGTKARSRLAAVSGSSGRLTAWAPKASNAVNALVATPDHKKIVVGGTFTKINTTTAVGMGAVDASTGRSRTWKVNRVVLDSGKDSAILSLAADGDTVYGTGYAFGGGNFEGTFAVNPADGSVRWLQDCHGDTYGVAPIGGTVYVVGHAHYCANIGGFPDTSPRVRWQRALALTRSARGTVAANGQHSVNYPYGDFRGQPAPSLYTWFPDLTAGTYTKQDQAAWSVVGNSTYISLGGEFPAVNDTDQQGLVRFAVAAKAPREQGPQVDDSRAAPALTAAGSGGVQVSWTTNSDRDDQTLRYRVLRDDQVVSPVLTASANFWDRTSMSWTDTAAAPGQTHRYVIRVSDPDGNTVDGPQTDIALP